MKPPSNDALVEELRRLVAWPTQKVASTTIHLRNLALQREGMTKFSDRALYAAIMNMITRTLQDVERPTAILLPSGSVTHVDAGRSARAYMLLFWLGQASPRAPHEQRRRLAIAELGLEMTVNYWRREGPEAAFLSALAERLRTQTADVDRYAHEAFDLTYRFDAEGRLFEHHVTARLRALTRQTPQSQLTLVTDSYPGHRFVLRHLIGCTTESEHEAPEGLPLQVVGIGPAMQSGDVLTVSAAFAVASRSQINHVSWFMGSAADLASIRLQFAPERVPERVWRFRDAPSPEEGMVEHSRATLVEPLDATFYETYLRPSRDRWFGLFWSWTS